MDSAQLWNRRRDTVWKLGVGLAVPIACLCGGLAFRSFVWNYFRPEFAIFGAIAILALYAVGASVVAALRMWNQPDRRSTGESVLVLVAFMALFCVPIGIVVAMFGDPG
jgi:hypothetical protein